MTTGKAIALTIWTFVGKVISLLFNMLSRFVRAFLQRSKHLLILWLQSSSAVIFMVAAKSLQSCPSLCYSRDGSPPGSPVPGILQARSLEWVAIPSPMRESEVAQLCPTLSNPMDCSLPGFSFHGIFQARVLEWGAIAFSEEKN